MCMYTSGENYYAVLCPVEFAMHEFLYSVCFSIQVSVSVYYFVLSVVFVL